MSKLIDKKEAQTLVNPSTPSKDLLKSYSVPLESEDSNEALVTITVKEVRYGGKTMPNSEIIAVNNGIKQSWEIPMVESYQKSFAKIEDEMVFKLAVTSNHDLLGFLYLEIPRKFKTMNTLKLDEWFPIKRLETEDKEKDIFQNYVAKIVIEYSAVRKVEHHRQVHQVLAKSELYNELATNMRDQISQLHSKVDAYNEDGFKYLDDFQAKVIKSKTINGVAKETEATKLFKSTAQPQKLIETQKDFFYRSRVVGAEDVTKASNFQTTTLTDRSAIKSQPNENEEASCCKCEKLFTELAYSNQELIQANIKIGNLEHSKMAPENLRLKKDIEAVQVELSKDRRELNLKLKSSNEGVDQESKRLRQNFEAENEKTGSLQTDAKTLQLLINERQANLELKEKEVFKKKEALSKRDQLANEKLSRLNSQSDVISKEKIQLEFEFADMTEMKNRMMLERERVYQEVERLQTLKSETEKKATQLTTLEEFLAEEKEFYKKEVAAQHLELDHMKAEVQKLKRIQELEIKTFSQNLNDFERRNNEHQDNISKHKIEIARLAREKNSHANKIVDFLEQKKIFEQEKGGAGEETGRNYEYLAEQSALLLEQKAEYNLLVRKLNDFEEIISAQSKNQEDQKNKFVNLQKLFFKKLQDSTIDVKEIKKLTEDVGVTIVSADGKFVETQQLEKELQKERQAIQKKIIVMSEHGSKEPSKSDLKSRAEIRFSTKKKDVLSVAGNPQSENKLKVQQDAAQLLDKIFSEAAFSVLKKQNSNKQEIVETLRFKIENLQEQIRALNEKWQSAKIDFLNGPIENGTGPAHNLEQQKLNHAENEHDENNMDTSQNISVPKQFKVLLSEEEKLNELQETIEDLWEATMINVQNDLKQGKEIRESQPQVKYLSDKKQFIKEMFKVLHQLNSAGQDKDIYAKESFDWDRDLLDHEKLKSQFEAKLKFLMEFIHQLKINNDFFNPGLDQGIMGN